MTKKATKVQNPFGHLNNKGASESSESGVFTRRLYYLKYDIGERSNRGLFPGMFYIVIDANTEVGDLPDGWEMGQRLNSRGETMATIQSSAPDNVLLLHHRKCKAVFDGDRTYRFKYYTPSKDMVDRNGRPLVSDNGPFPSIVHQFPVFIDGLELDKPIVFDLYGKSRHIIADNIPGEPYNVDWADPGFIQMLENYNEVALEAYPGSNLTTYGTWWVGFEVVYEEPGVPLFLKTNKDATHWFNPFRIVLKEHGEAVVNAETAKERDLAYAAWINEWEKEWSTSRNNGGGSGPITLSSSSTDDDEDDTPKPNQIPQQDQELIPF